MPSEEPGPGADSAGTGGSGSNHERPALETPKGPHGTPGESPYRGKTPPGREGTKRTRPRGHEAQETCGFLGRRLRCTVSRLNPRVGADRQGYPRRLGSEDRGGGPEECVSPFSHGDETWLRMWVDLLQEARVKE